MKFITFLFIIGCLSSLGQSYQSCGFSAETRSNYDEKLSVWDVELRVVKPPTSFNFTVEYFEFTKDETEDRKSKTRDFSTSGYDCREAFEDDSRVEFFCRSSSTDGTYSESENFTFSELEGFTDSEFVVSTRYQILEQSSDKRLRVEVKAGGCAEVMDIDTTPATCNHDLEVFKNSVDGNTWHLFFKIVKPPNNFTFKATYENFSSRETEARQRKISNFSKNGFKCELKGQNDSSLDYACERGEEKPGTGMGGHTFVAGMGHTVYVPSEDKQVTLEVNAVGCADQVYVFKFPADCHFVQKTSVKFLRPIGSGRFLKVDYELKNPPEEFTLTGARTVLEGFTKTESFTHSGYSCVLKDQSTSRYLQKKEQDEKAKWEKIEKEEKIEEEERRIRDEIEEEERRIRDEMGRERERAREEREERERESSEEERRIRDEIEEEERRIRDEIEEEERRIRDEIKNIMDKLEDPVSFDCRRSEGTASASFVASAVLNSHVISLRNMFVVVSTADGTCKRWEKIR